MARTPVLLGLVVVLLAGGVAWWALRGDDAAPVAADGPVAQPMDPLRAREISHRDPFPHGTTFDADFAALRGEGDPDADLSEEKLMHANELAVYPVKVSAKFQAAKVEDVVANLKTQLAPTGVNVFTYGTGDLDHVRFTLDLEDVRVDQLIDQLRMKSHQDLKYYMTSLGLCIGSVRDIQQAQLDARAELARKRSARERPSAILDREFRPDFANAWIGPIARMIREQTGIEVVVDQPTWSNPRELTWRAEPMPLRDALDKICRELGCVPRVRDGRLFLIAP